MSDAISRGARTRVLILSHDLIGPQMAGPGIRYWELSRILAHTCAVTLAAPVAGALPETEWLVHPLTFQDAQEIDPLLANADVVISNGFLIYQYPQLAEMSIPWVVDAYIPSPIEGLAYYRTRSLDEQRAVHSANTEALNRFFKRGDFFICANERQRDLYLGVLAACGRVNPYTFGQDDTLHEIIACVPFGLSSEPPLRRRAVLKGVQDGVSPTDKVVLWGGGIWDWLDPLTLVRAIARIVERRPDVRLYFPGPRHPFRERVPDMAMHQRTVALSDALGLTGKHVFFGDWMPHQERADYLLEADVGVSLHPTGVEARFAHRTRVLDYIWAGLPMVLTAGDALAELVQERGLGLIVEPGDVEAVAEALLRLLDEPDARAARRSSFQAAAAELTWDVVARPLVRFCQQPRLAADKLAGYRPGWAANDELLRLRSELEEARARERELADRVAAYERGRFMRFMASVKRWRTRLRKIRT